MAALWAKAPFALLRHPPLLVALVIATALAAAAAAAAPFVRAGVGAKSLKGQLQAMGPLATGLEIQTAGSATTDRARQAAAVALVRQFPFLATPVLTTELQAVLSTKEGDKVPIVLMARTGAVAHVTHLTPGAGTGTWISSAIAKPLHIKPGADVRLARFRVADSLSATGTPFRVSGIYQGLDGDLENDYWVNFLHDIRPGSIDAALPPSFVLVSEQALLRFARSQPVDNRFEFPADPTHITVAGARSLDRQFVALEAELARPGSAGAQRLGCRAAGSCTTTTSLDSALRASATDVASVSPVVSLVSGCAIAISICLVFAVGAFLVVRRAGEVAFLYARGEPASHFFVRTVLEGLLPVATGAAGGLALGLLALRLFAPTGGLDSGTFHAGLIDAATAGGVAAVAFGVGAGVNFPRASSRAHALARVARIPWELLPLAAAAALLVDILIGGGLTRTSGGAVRPRLEVFVVPIVAAAGGAGLVARGVRLLLRRPKVAAFTPVVFIAMRRLGAARGLLVAVVVLAAAAFSTFTYATSLRSSLERGVAKKAFLSNGSDIQALVDPSLTITSPFPFPAVVVQDDHSGDVMLPSGAGVDLLAGEPAAMARTIQWGSGWSGDPRRFLDRLEHAKGRPLAALATPDTPDATFIDDQGTRIPIRIVGRTQFPGTTVGSPALIVSSKGLRSITRRTNVPNPSPSASGLLWAKGEPSEIEPILRRSKLAPVYITTADELRRNPSVVASLRTFGYFDAIGAAAAGLALLVLLLYLHARQRSQLIASALLSRMGFSAVTDAAALALESASLIFISGTVGLATAAATSGPLVHRTDPLPDYAPGTELVLPWVTLLAWLLCATAAAAVVGGAASALARRSDVAEALRVA